LDCGSKWKMLRAWRPPRAVPQYRTESRGIEQRSPSSFVVVRSKVAYRSAGEHSNTPKATTDAGSPVWHSRWQYDRPDEVLRDLARSAVDCASANYAMSAQDNHE